MELPSPPCDAVAAALSARYGAAGGLSAKKIKRRCRHTGWRVRSKVVSASRISKPSVTFRQDCRKVRIALSARETAHRRYIRRL